MLAYERRSGDHTKLISELTQKVGNMKSLSRRFCPKQVSLFRSEKIVFVIVLHAVQFGNNWMRKIMRTVRGIFFNPIISNLNKHVVLLPIKARANARNIVGQQDATLLGPTCCERLHTMLRVVATCWKLLDEV